MWKSPFHPPFGENRVKYGGWLKSHRCYYGEQLETAGNYDSRVAHGMLWGPTEGKVRNITRLPGAQQISAEEAVKTCKKVDQGEPMEGSLIGGSRLVMAGLLAGTSLFLVNSVIFACLCYRRTQHRPRWDRASGCTIGADSTECLNNSIPETPHRVPSFSTPGRTSTIRRAESRERALPLSSYPGMEHECPPCSTHTTAGPSRLCGTSLGSRHSSTGRLWKQEYEH